MKTNQKPARSLIHLRIVLTMTYLLGLIRLDAQTDLIFPTNHNHFQDSYQLPDGTIRIIGNELEHYTGLFYVDRLPDGLITSPKFYPSSIGDQVFNFAGIGCHVLPLKDGNCILGINQIDCDYPPPPGICSSDASGEILWGDYLQEYILESYIERLVLVDENVFCILFQHGEKLYFNTEGNHIESPEDYIVYDQVINAPQGYIAASGSTLIILDDQFEKLDSIDLDEQILTILPVGDTAIIVSTQSSIILLNDDLTEILQTELYSQINKIAASKESFWLTREDRHELYAIRPNLTPKDTFAIPSDIQIKDLKVIDDTVVLSGNYSSAIGSSMFFHASPADSFSFEVEKDIRIDGIAVAQPVWYSPEPFSFGGYNIGYDSVVVSVTNTGLDVINTINIQYKEDTGCGMCDGGHVEWSFDSLLILPGQQQFLHIGTFSVWCRQANVHQLCLRAAPADSLPEVEELNNKFCADIIAFLTGVNELNRTEWKLSPNPAHDFITLSTEQSIVGNHQGIIVDGRGIQLEKFKLSEASHTIDLTDYTPGIYFIKISNSQGLYSWEKFVVIH
ncbi:MAG TPA: T9SS type A sorting domain-containing protein [Saprospiraceae bacterium]